MNPFSEQIAVRLTADQRRSLEEIARRSPLSRSLADHIRYAIDSYVEDENERLQLRERDDYPVAVAPI